MDRREFIKAVEAVALCGGAAGILSGCASLTYVTPAVEGNRLVVDRAEMIDHVFVLVRHPGSDRPIYLHRHDDDTFTAVSTRCTHKGCQVEPAGPLLVCPCHGSEFALQGGVTEGPAERDLPSYPVTADASQIVIRLEGATGAN